MNIAADHPKIIDRFKIIFCISNIVSDHVQRNAKFENYCTERMFWMYSISVLSFDVHFFEKRINTLNF